MTQQPVITKDERESLNIANCLICTLGTKMRDCARCEFNAGLIVKNLQVISVQVVDVDLSAIRGKFLELARNTHIELSIP